jgi:hypothetical protein
MAASIEAFCESGFIAVRDAVRPEVVRACVGVIEDELRAHGIDSRDPTTWTGPVVRFVCPDHPAFTAAGTASPLREMYDTFLGPCRWMKRNGVGGILPIRFPSKRDPGDAGWHIDGSYDVDGAWWIKVCSRGRGLLVLFLFTDVADDDAPTEVIVGSHLDVPQVLMPFGERGVFFGNVAGRLPSSTFERPRAHADWARGGRVSLSPLPRPPRDLAAPRGRAAHDRPAGDCHARAVHAARPCRRVRGRAGRLPRPRLLACATRQSMPASPAAQRDGVSRRFGT